MYYGFYRLHCLVDNNMWVVWILVKIKECEYQVGKHSFKIDYEGPRFCLDRVLMMSMFEQKRHIV